MNLGEFWRLIDESREEAEGDPDAQAKVLADKLAKLAVEDILEFEELFHERIVESYDWTLWGAAYVINGGCSDDGFDYFRAWLIAQGPIVKRTLASPDSLAELLTDEQMEFGVECETIMYAGLDAYKAATGKEQPRRPYRTKGPREPTGKQWDDSDLPTLLPKLNARFG